MITLAYNPDCGKQTGGASPTRSLSDLTGGAPETVTLTEAQQHCSRDDTHGTRAGVRWFDGYDYMPGCRPRE